MGRKRKLNNVEKIALIPDLLEAVKEQISCDETVYVKEIYDKLLEKGIAEEIALEKIAEKLKLEMWHVMYGGEEFDIRRFKKYLLEI